MAQSCAIAYQQQLTAERIMKVAEVRLFSMVQSPRSWTRRNERY